ncbi:MAG: DUF2807 domain-containing protein, partial [Bacteroidota bacterium]
ATVTVSGSGTYQGFNIIADNYIVTLSGSGNIELTANDALNSTISGSGFVLFQGAPVITSVISGSGLIVDAN